ncbi:MAG: type I-A CRISPR-associated protein Cas4/Csa1 [Bacillota bacterium]|nr:MAG: type I-A CRISPR-associated protein Cas4/Csa1 [Bacillota bacterium]
MYFLSDDERKQLLKGLLPKTRQTEVADELRGWNWHQPPIEPVYPVRLALHEVAGRYCPTGRDVYLRHVQGLKAEATVAMIQGALFHAVVGSVLLAAKRIIYIHGVERYRDILKELTSISESDEFGDEVRSQLSRLPADQRDQVTAKARTLRDFEVTRIAARIQDILVRQPHIGTDSLASLAIPVVVEQKIDGSFMGLSSQLSVDAYTALELMILDTKFAQKRDFHRLTTTGYAMVSEAVNEYPVNIGCIVYARFVGDRLTVEKDFHIIDDELRQWFLEERDQKSRSVYEELDPGLADDCPGFCSYRPHCHPS